MSTIAKLQEDLQEVETAQFITVALRDINSIKFGKIRKGFEENTEFFKEVHELYGLVKASAQHMAEEMGGDTQSSVYVAMTSNKRFYGTLNRDVIDFTLKHLRGVHGDCFVVGQTGQQYIQQLEGAPNYKTVVFADDTPTPQEMSMLLQRLSVYDRIFVVHSRFVNPFKQDVAMVDISHTPESTAQIAEASVDYIFEPEIQELLIFFETQVRYSLFKRAILDIELARTAARLIKMYRAQERAKDSAADLRHKVQRAAASLANMHLLEKFSGLKKWKQRT